MIYAVNDKHDTSLIHFEVDGATKRSIRLPPKSPGQWHWAWLLDDGSIAWSVEDGRPSRSVRLLSAWGTYPRQTAPMQQVQIGNEVMFSGDHVFDADFGGRHDLNGDDRYVRGNGLWQYRGNYGGWPKALTSAVVVRGEAGRPMSQGPGLAQINFSSLVHEGTTSRPSVSFIDQVKGYSSTGNCDASGNRTIPIDPEVGALGVMINAQSMGIYLNSGFILRL